MKVRNHLASIAAGALALGVASAPALAADRFSEWDTDKSGSISSEEFRAGMQEGKIYESWRGEKPALTLQDFRASLGERDDFNAEESFQAWDADGDDGLTEEEFSAGWYGNYDADANEELDEDEFSLFEGDADDDGWFD